MDTKYVTTTVPVTARMDWTHVNNIGADKTQVRIELMAKYLTNHGHGLYVNGSVVPFASLTKNQKLQIVGEYVEKIIAGISLAAVRERKQAEIDALVNGDDAAN